MRLVITQAPDGAWCQLEGDCAAQWDRLETAAAESERTAGAGWRPFSGSRRSRKGWEWP
jgi:hypothetical protein